jgi:protein-disulfide isomerase
VANKSKRPASYDLKAADRKRNLWVQIGLTLFVIALGAGLAVYIVSHGKAPARSGDIRAVRVATANVVTKDGSSEPKAVVALYEDFQCPHCQQFEKTVGPTVNKLIDSGAIAADYHMVAILDTKVNDNFSTRAANAGYCVADADTSPAKDVFRRYHAALFAQQPPEGASAPDNAALIETARQAGVVGSVPDCINSGKNSEMVKGLAAAAKITATPTIRINGEDYAFTTPDALVSKVKEIVGNLPGLETSAAPAAP